MITRRRLLQSMALAAGCSLLPLGKYGFAMATDAPAKKRLIVLFLRGAVDGLSVVVPYDEPEYYAHRSTIALQSPGKDGGVLDLDGFFGLHPSLAPIMPYWQSKSLAFVHASGFPSNVRSHFEAQDIIETASLNPKATQTGWMNALLDFLPDNHAPTRALSFSGALPRIFMGHTDVATVPSGLKPDSKITFDNPKAEHAFDTLYASDSQLHALFEEAKTSRDQLIGALKKEMEEANNNAPYPDGFPGQAARLAAMIKQDERVQLAFMDIGGWDTHANQGNAKGQLANRLEKLGEGLHVLADGLGKHYRDTMVLVVSEFGRTVAENGNNGTDHGHGNAMWLMGGGIQGGKVYGNWPGLAQDKLFEGRDLAVTTDFRSAIGAVLNRHLGLSDIHIAKVLPDYNPSAAMKAMI